MEICTPEVNRPGFRQQLVQRELLPPPIFIEIFLYWDFDESTKSTGRWSEVKAAVLGSIKIGTRDIYVH